MNMTRSVADLVHASGVAFGTSGARGLVAAMTDEVCHGYTTGFLRHLQSIGTWQPEGRVAIAGDLRPSSPRIMAACALAIEDLGGAPEFCGFVPTPALAFYAMRNCIPAIMVTGSHIPDDRNGIKFYRPDGEILKADEALILEQAVGKRHWATSGMITEPAPLGRATDIARGYIARYVDMFGATHLEGLRVGVYQHSAVGRDILTDILSALGARTFQLGRSGQFIPVDTEAVRPEDVALAKEWAATHQFDAIVSTDGDSDRPLFADENGDWLRGDVLAMLCARELQMETVITPVSSNTVVERCGAFQCVERTKIGSPYVIEAMQKAIREGATKVCGYEANGGFLLGSHIQHEGGRLSALPTRDAVLPIIAVLAAARGRSISGLVGSLPSRFTYSGRIPDFVASRREALFEWLLTADTAELGHLFSPIVGADLANVDWTDGARLAFTNERLVHLRASGNAPELRCYAETEERSVAERLADAVLAIVSDRF